MPNCKSLNNKLLKALNYKGYPIAIDAISKMSTIQDIKPVTTMYIVKDLSKKGKDAKLFASCKPQEVTKFLAQLYKERR